MSLFKAIYRYQYNKFKWNTSLILVITMGKTMTACHPGLNVNNGIHKAIVRCWNKHYEKLSSSGKGSKNH